MSHRYRLFSTFISILLLTFIISATTVGAADYVIGPGDSAGLIAAISAAKLTPEADTITLSAGSTYTFSTVNNTSSGPNAFPTINSAITLIGNGAIIERDPAAPAMRFFYVLTSGNLTLQDVTLRNGLLTSSYQGGAIYNAGILTVTNAILEANTANSGGAIGNTSSGTVMIGNSVLQNNVANTGGAINSTGNVTITDSRLLNNSSTAFYNGLNGTATLDRTVFDGNSGSQGGGLRTYRSATHISGSLFTNNTAPSGSGGAINNSYSTITVVNTTFSGNSATTHGGAIANFVQGDMQISYSTVMNNSAMSSSGALYNASAMAVKNVIVANSAGTQDCRFYAAATILDHNLDTTGTCGFDITAEPGLGPLQDNGGPTLSHGFEIVSAAIDGATTCETVAGVPVTTDQRGVARPQGSGCDLGAFENDDPGVPTVTSIAPTDTPTGFATNTPVPTNTASPTAFATNTPAPTNTPTPQPTDTPAPTATPSGGPIEVGPGDSAGLIAAINTANSIAGPDSIILAAGSTYTLTTVVDTDLGNNGLPRITTPITIVGNGAIIERDLTAPTMRIFRITGLGSLEMSGVTLRNGLLLDGGSTSTTRGGAIFNSGVLTLTDSILENNQATYAGAIYNQGTAVNTLTLNNVTLRNNRAIGNSLTNSGGAILNYNTMYVYNSLFEDNVAEEGAGLSNQGSVIVDNTVFQGNSHNAMRARGTFTISNSTFDSNAGPIGGAISINGASSGMILNSTFVNNTATYTGGGGAIQNYASTTRIINSTFSGNSAPQGNGGAISNYYLGNLEINHSTFVNNTAPSNSGTLHVMSSSTSLSVKNSVIANSVGSPDCRLDKAIQVVGVNLSSDTSCGFSLIGDPALGPLQNNGGLTLTHGFAGPSLAMNATADCTTVTGEPVTTDQRSVARPQLGTECDLGAFENDDPGIPTVTPGPTLAPSNTPAPTNTIAPTNTPLPTYTPSKTPTPAPTNTPLPTNTPAPTNTSTPGPSNTPAPTLTPSNTPGPTNTPAPTLTPSNTPAPTNTSTPVPSNTPAPPPTETPVPTDTPTSTPEA